MQRYRKIVCLALAVLMLLGLMSPALAASTVITNQDNSYDYFEYYGSNGEWNDLNTPYHYDSAGNLAYCIEHKKDPPSSGAPAIRISILPPFSQVPPSPASRPSWIMGILFLPAG